MSDTETSQKKERRKATMDMTEHQKTWDGFMAGSIWGTLIICAAVGFLVLWLAVGMGFLPSLALSVIVTAIIAYFFT